MGARSPLAMLCQGYQLLLLPFSSLFHEFSEKFLQVGASPSQGRVGGRHFCAISLPVPVTMGRRDSPTC